MTITRNAMIVIAAVVLPLVHASVRAAQSVRAVDLVEASAFLERYREANLAQSSEFYDLYTDRAVVHVRVHDREPPIVFQGRAFTAWGRQLLKEGKTALDGSVFRDATVEQRGNRLVIRAKRYSTTRCYWDADYVVGIEREGAAYRIIEEQLMTNSAAQCGSGISAAGGSRAVRSSELRTLGPASAAGQSALFTGEPSWHAVSQQELAEKSLRLAEQTAGARALRPEANSTTSASVTAIAPPRVSLSELVVWEPDAPAALRFTPKDRE